MMAPMIAVSQVEMSKNSSRGSASKSAPARKPPISAPTTPIIAVTRNPPGSSPGRSAFAIAPASRPRTMNAIIPTRGSSPRIGDGHYPLFPDERPENAAHRRDGSYRRRRQPRLELDVDDRPFLALV